MWICVPHWLKINSRRTFFAYAQKALQRTDSCYYSLIHRLLDSVDEDRICTVGVNMGFGGLIYGASELKKQADLEGQPIAWITAARCGDERLSELVPKAARHGSFVWLLDATDTDPAQVVLLAKANPQSAFGLLADPSALTEDCVKTLGGMPQSGGHAAAADAGADPRGLPRRPPPESPKDVLCADGSHR